MLRKNCFAPPLFFNLPSACFDATFNFVMMLCVTKMAFVVKQRKDHIAHKRVNTRLCEYRIHGEIVLEATALQIVSLEF